MRSKTLEKPTLRWLHGSIVALLCVAMLSCGDAGDEPQPPAGYLQIEAAVKDEECYITQVVTSLQQEHIAAARLFAQSPCKYVHSLTVESIPGIRDLSFLEGLSMVEGETWITGNSELRSLEGLDSLTRTDVLHVRFNASLETLQGLESLKEVSPPNDPLVNPSVTPGAIRIEDNASLRSLDGLENLEISTSLYLTNNTSLRSMKALYGMKSVDYVTITNSPIPRCQINEFLSRLDNEPIEVELNAVGSGDCADE